MKQSLQKLVRAALGDLITAEGLACEIPATLSVERTRDKQHGDFASNIALVLARAAHQKPRDLATQIVAHLPSSTLVDQVVIAGPGFINFHLTPSAWQETVADILSAGEDYGRSTLGNGKRIQVEFVSANPTGPLHVGHGRGAAYGAAVADLLAATGYDVHREYYVNDAGRQMDILATSVFMRYLELAGERITFPANGYMGDYIWDIAASLHREHGDRYRHPGAEVCDGLPADEADGGNRETHINALIERVRGLLGETGYSHFYDRAIDTILTDIRQDLAEFGITYDEWYSERSLISSGRVEGVIEALRDAGELYEQEGALWFRSTTYGDEKDRVVVRDNGVKTYFASDIAYHAHKLERGYDHVIDIWGADHHGYVPRVKAALTAMGDAEDAQRLDVLLVQFALLYRGGEKMQMSTRSGEFVTLRELRAEVGNDAARFFYVLRKCEQHMDFDLDLAREQSNDNPLYYIQYAHARICSVFRQMGEKEIQHLQADGLLQLQLLTETHEQALLVTLSRYPEVVEMAAVNHEPHLLAYYLRELATDFHTYYNAHPFLVDEANMRDARLVLIAATRQVLANGLGLLGVSAPEKM